MTIKLTIMNNENKCIENLFEKVSSINWHCDYGKKSKKNKKKVQTDLVLEMNYKKVKIQLEKYKIHYSGLHT